MRLFFYRSETGNFGDDLNEWLWPRVTPGLLTVEDDILLVGIGTILDERIPKEHKKVILGSGIRYPNRPPEVDSSWDIRVVRGPLSAKALKIERHFAITDPAVLVSLFFEKRDSQKVYEISFIPHFRTAINGVWEEICHSIGFHYIDPRSSPEVCMSEIWRSKLIVTESLHGAIIADALRVPWIRVRMNVKHTEKDVNLFKWNDWCLSMDIKHNYLNLPCFWSGAEPRITESLKKHVKRFYIERKLVSYAKEDNATMTSDKVLYDRVERWKEVLDKVLCDYLHPKDS